MDSKNFIWLSSFFALLFITFCVTRHLDDLNPHIISMPRESQEINAELAVVILDNDIQNSFVPKLETPKLETPKLETPKLETPKLETPKLETPKLETPKLIKEKTELFTSEEMKKVVTKKEEAIVSVLKQPLNKKQPQDIKKAKKVKKPKVIITKAKRIKRKTTRGKAYTIGAINLDSIAMQAILSRQNNNELNKLAYMHNINKGSTIQISTNDTKAANSLKKYLQKQNVHKKDIHIISNEKAKNLIKITLIGRK